MQYKDKQNKSNVFLQTLYNVIKSPNVGKNLIASGLSRKNRTKFFASESGLVKFKERVKENYGYCSWKK